MRIRKLTKKKLFGLILFSLVATGTCEAGVYVPVPELTQGQRFRTPPGLLFRTAIKKGWDMSKVDVRDLKWRERVYYDKLSEYYYKSYPLRYDLKSNTFKRRKDLSKVNVNDLLEKASVYKVDWESKEKPWKFAFSHSRGRTRDNLAIFAGRLIGTGLIVFPLALIGFIMFFYIRPLYVRIASSAERKNKLHIKPRKHLISNVTPTKEYVKKRVVWLCENCKTENEDNLDICCVCGVETTGKPQNVQGDGEGYNLDRTKYASHSNISNQQEKKLLYNNKNQTGAIGMYGKIEGITFFVLLGVFGCPAYMLMYWLPSVANTVGGVIMAGAVFGMSLWLRGIVAEKIYNWLIH